MVIALGIVCVFVGIIIGYFLMVRSIKPAGTLKIVDNPESDSPLLFLELNSEVHNLYGQRYVSMQVRDLRRRSQK